MISFIVHVSDASNLDEQKAVKVDAANDLGRAAHIALDEILAKNFARVIFPLFVDIHPEAEFENRAWMHCIQG
jgi:hypothetical protein